MRRYNDTLSQWWIRAVQRHFFQSGFQLAAPITFVEDHGVSAGNFASFPTINRQAMNALAAAEIRFADRKQKVEFQPALRLARSKQIISPSTTLR
jgi:hypothetical protein